MKNILQSYKNPFSHDHFITEKKEIVDILIIYLPHKKLWRYKIQKLSSCLLNNDKGIV